MRVERIGDATLYLGDCHEALQEIAPVSCVLTDPPYGIDYASGHATPELWPESRIRNDKDTVCRNVALALFDPDMPKLVFGSRKAPLPPGCKMVLTWDKGPALGMGDLSIPWKPSTEEIYVLGKGFVGRRDEGAVIYHPPVQSMAKNGRLHPNEKPVGLLRRLLQKMPPGRVCDPFMGSGSAGVAAVIEGRPFVGIECVPHFFEIALRQIEAAQRQSDLFVPSPRADLDAAYQRAIQFDGPANV
jgi:hypothetical protein